MKRFHSIESVRKRTRRKKDIHPAQKEWAMGWTHNFNKQSPHDCGKAKCGVCSQERYRDQPRTKKWEIPHD